MNFPTDALSIEKRIEAIDPIAYAKSRNYLNGSVTYISPYLTHGYITLPYLRDRVLKRFSKKDSYTFIFELAWREFFSRTWEMKGDAIFTSLKHEQEGVHEKKGLPKAYLLKKTGIRAIDTSLHDLEESGYVHNHARMWMAMLITNVAKIAWWEGARHMYYHLLDGDRASNSLSWQWVTGTFSSKRYIANQEMINKYALTPQYETYLDVPVETLLTDKGVPQELSDSSPFKLPLDDGELLFSSFSLSEMRKKETWLYSMWTLDPQWTPTISGNSGDVEKILFVEREDLALFPMSAKRITFFLELAKNITGIKVFYGSLSDIEKALSGISVYKKHHPGIFHWLGTVSSPDYLFPEVKEVPGGFMSYWKKCEAYLYSK